MCPLRVHPFFVLIIPLLPEQLSYNRIVSNKKTTLKMNLFETSHLTHEKEQSEEILREGTLLIEKLTSFGHPTPNGDWYDQAQREWVALLEGSATLRFQDGRSIEMIKGDHIIIEPHEVHRVETVSFDAIWIAVFIP